MLIETLTDNIYHIQCRQLGSNYIIYSKKYLFKIFIFIKNRHYIFKIIPKGNFSLFCKSFFFYSCHTVFGIAAAGGAQREFLFTYITVRYFYAAAAAVAAAAVAVAYDVDLTIRSPRKEKKDAGLRDFFLSLTLSPSLPLSL